jgi:ERCC4-related helicase
MFTQFVLTTVKRVWFLAPTVTLCEQQGQVFAYNLPSYNVIVLSGQDGVDHWTEQSVWDSVLHNVRIVLSTHQVLYDALAHGFVKMDDLALLIFDEGQLNYTKIVSINAALDKSRSSSLYPQSSG